MRAISTVLDVSLAVLLVSVAAVTLVAIPGHKPRPADPDATARAVLLSTTNVTYHAQTGQKRLSSGSVATLLGHAAVSRHRDANPRFVLAVEAAVAGVLADFDKRIGVSAFVDGTRIFVGLHPPPGASVAMVTHRVTVGNTSVLVSVRTWSA